MTHAAYNADVVCRPARPFNRGKFSPNGAPVCHCSLACRQLRPILDLSGMLIAFEMKRLPDRCRMGECTGVLRKSTA